MSARTGWIKKFYSTKGLDPLGVQAPCINIYGQLLPGITNVTNRARYYSFYPWMIWAFDQLPGNKTRGDLIRWVRRADCLFTLIGIRHLFKNNDNNSLKHDARLVGSQKLRPALAKLKKGERIYLSKYTALGDDNPQRYFKNRLGGLGQYYFGTLNNFGLMGKKAGEIGYTDPKGREMAEAFDSAVDRRSFAEAAQSDVVSVDQLDELSAFCPCNLASSVLEHEMLLDFFFDRKSEHGDDGLQRKHSLGLLLDLIHCLQEDTSESEVLFDDDLFRACVYTESLPGGKGWNVPTKLRCTLDGWAVYQRNELLSVAIQSIFWAALRTMEDSGIHPHTVEEFAQWFGSSKWVKGATSELKFKSFNEALGHKRSMLPELSKWESPEHEISMASEVLDLHRHDKERDVRVDVLRLASHIVLNLIARDDAVRTPYDPMTFSNDYFVLYPVNLKSLREAAAGKWQGMKLTDWYGWLAGYWGLETHLRVALRKLHHQSQDTFHVSPTDQGLQVEHLPDPTYTSPRFSTTMQILQDLGTLERKDGGKNVRLTELGEELRRIGLE